MRKDDEITVKLYGEVQKEVIAALLESEYGLTVTFSETRPIHVERPTGTGTAIREMGDPDNPWAAGVGFRISPGVGIDYRLEVELGGLPRAFHTAVEETARRTLQQGLHGWEVVDCLIELVSTQYSSPVTVAADFRRLVPLVLLQALQEAGESQLPGLTHGEGVLLTSFHGFHPVPGTPPDRHRTDGNPLNQKEYLLHLNQT